LAGETTWAGRGSNHAVPRSQKTRQIESGLERVGSRRLVTVWSGASIRGVSSKHGDLEIRLRSRPRDVCPEGFAQVRRFSPTLKSDAQARLFNPTLKSDSSLQRQSDASPTPVRRQSDTSPTPVRRLSVACLTPV
jgi:hypothetical protein